MFRVLGNYILLPAMFYYSRKLQNAYLAIDDPLPTATLQTN